MATLVTRKKYKIYFSWWELYFIWIHQNSWKWNWTKLLLPTASVEIQSWNWQSTTLMLQDSLRLSQSPLLLISSPGSRLYCSLLPQKKNLQLVLCDQEKFWEDLLYVFLLDYKKHSKSPRSFPWDPIVTGKSDPTQLAKTKNNNNNNNKKCQQNPKPCLYTMYVPRTDPLDGHWYSKCCIY